jgi:uncharacterized protein
MSALTEFVKSAVMRRLDRSEQSTAHRFDHIERVMRHARRIAATIEGIDLEILELAVLLHDVEQPAGRKAEHVALSLAVAEQILREAGCPEPRAKQVLQVIAEHSSEHVEATPPTTDEARVLFDADKLDGLGAIGVARVFSLFGQMDRPPLEAIGWYRGKIEVALAHIQTEAGRRLCEERLGYVEEFLARLTVETTVTEDVWTV